MSEIKSAESYSYPTSKQSIHGKQEAARIAEHKKKFSAKPKPTSHRGQDNFQKSTPNPVEQDMGKLEKAKKMAHSGVQKGRKKLGQMGHSIRTSRPVRTAKAMKRNAPRKARKFVQGAQRQAGRVKKNLTPSSQTKARGRAVISGGKSGLKGAGGIAGGTVNIQGGVKNIKNGNYAQGTLQVTQGVYSVGDEMMEFATAGSQKFAQKSGELAKTKIGVGLRRAAPILNGGMVLNDTIQTAVSLRKGNTADAADSGANAFIGGLVTTTGLAVAATEAGTIAVTGMTATVGAALAPVAVAGAVVDAGMAVTGADEKMQRDWAPMLATGKLVELTEGEEMIASFRRFRPEQLKNLNPGARRQLVPAKRYLLEERKRFEEGSLEAKRIDGELELFNRYIAGRGQ